MNRSLCVKCGHDISNLCHGGRKTSYVCLCKKFITTNPEGLGTTKNMKDKKCGGHNPACANPIGICRRCRKFADDHYGELLFCYGDPTSQGKFTSYKWKKTSDKTDCTNQEIIGKAWKKIFKYSLEELGEDLIMDNGTPKNIVEFAKEVLKLKTTDNKSYTNRKEKEK